MDSGADRGRQQPAAGAGPSFSVDKYFSLFRGFKGLLSVASLPKALIVAAVAGAGAGTLSFDGSGGGFSGGSGGGGWGGDGGGDWSGNGWDWFMSLYSGRALADDEFGESFDSHGLRVGLKVPVNKLNAAKKYKVSDVELIDKRTKQSIGTKDPFFELVTLRPGGIYTKQQLETEVENLLNCGMFQSIEMETLTQPDGTLTSQISFVESQWHAADSFKCANVGLLTQSRPPESEATMSDQQREEYMKMQEEEYKNRLRQARPCMLPQGVEREIASWLRQETKVSARMLQRIRDRVQRWYHDEGYACAQVVNFGNLNTNEVVCEVVEGDVTRVQIMFQDRMGNPCEGNTSQKIIERELPSQVTSSDVLKPICDAPLLRRVCIASTHFSYKLKPTCLAAA